LFASARLAARSVPRYRRFGTLFSEGLRNAWVAAQSTVDADRFIALGADPARTRVVGNLKFDMRLGETVAGNGRELRRYLGARPVWTAGSTHEGEEELVLDAHTVIERAVRGTLLVLVPRHPQRFEGVAALLARRGLVFDRRGRSDTVRPGAQVLLLDTMGELTDFYAASDTAFVGGSLVPVGGHNLLEPAALGVPVITGPHTQNSPEIARLLIEAGGALEVADAAALADAAGRLLADPALRERMGESARRFVETHRGSLARLLALIEPLLAAEAVTVLSSAEPT
jgi:3-deoxy-D-manno-octulosonic-acid transferase